MGCFQTGRCAPGYNRNDLNTDVLFVFLGLWPQINDHPQKRGRLFADKSPFYRESIKWLSYSSFRLAGIIGRSSGDPEARPGFASPATHDDQRGISVCGPYPYRSRLKGTPCGLFCRSKGCICRVALYLEGMLAAKAREPEGDTLPFLSGFWHEKCKVRFQTTTERMQGHGHSKSVWGKLPAA